MKNNWKFIRQAEQNVRLVKDWPELETIIKEILYFRGVDNQEKIQRFLAPNYEKDLADPFLLTDMTLAVERVRKALEKQELVCIYGDYDADGVTSSALLKDLFSWLGLNSICYIPERNSEGYGMNNKALDYIKQQGVALIVSVDCGVSNVEEVEYAKSLGLDVIVLDHHHVPEQVPNALAVINPKRPGDQYPEKELAGVGVAFKFAQALVSKIPGVDNQQLKWLLDLVAIGTIADCVPLLGENRTLVKFGLIVLSRTRRVGLHQIFQVGKININEHHPATSYQVAFHLAPRINAAGRVDHANSAFELLTLSAEQTARARVLALEMEDKNQHRQKITAVITKEVERRVKEKVSLPKIIIETDPHWELGVIGLAAGKITEKFYRPTILLKKMPEEFKGSGRSIKPFNLIEALENVKDILKKFGGHKQAAGMAIASDKLVHFRSLMKEQAEKLSDQQFERLIEIDDRLQLSDINENLISQLERFEPFGQENRQPIFLSQNVSVQDWRLVGNGSKHLKVWLKSQDEGSPKIFEGICFGVEEKACQVKTGDHIDIVYTLEEDNWNGNKKIQLKIIDLEKVSE